MVKEKEIKKTYYTLDIKNPYCGKGEFAWKHNDDSTLGGEFHEGPIINNTEEEIKKAKKKEDIWRKKHSSYY